MNEMFELILQLHGKKSGSSTNVQSYTPTEEEKRLLQQQSDYVEHAAPNAYWLNDTARELLQDSIGAIQVDYNAMHNAAQNQLANAQQGVANLTNGLLPAEYQANMENAIRSGVQNTMGNMVGNLGSRGVLNSSVTNTAMNDISKNVSDTMAQQYSNNISNVPTRMDPERQARIAELQIKYYEPTAWNPADHDVVEAMPQQVTKPKNKGLFKTSGGVKKHKKKDNKPVERPAYNDVADFRRMNDTRFNR